MEIIERIDAALGCQHCHGPIPADSATPDFCRESHQTAWHSEHATPTDNAGDYLNLVSTVGPDRALLLDPPR